MKKFLPLLGLVLLTACSLPGVTSTPTPVPTATSTRIPPTPIPDTATPTPAPTPTATDIPPERYFADEFDIAPKYWSTLYASGDQDRVEVLSALRAVDHILVFDGDTPLPEIEALLPDVLVKGEDWKGKGVVGQEVVEAEGGKVVLVPLLPGLSSTKLINRMKEDR